MPNWCNNNIQIEGPLNKLEELSKKYGFTFTNKEEMSLMDIKAGPIQFKEDEIRAIVETAEDQFE